MDLMNGPDWNWMCVNCGFSIGGSNTEKRHGCLNCEGACRCDECVERGFEEAKGVELDRAAVRAIIAILDNPTYSLAYSVAYAEAYRVLKAQMEKWPA